MTVMRWANLKKRDRLRKETLEGHIEWRNAKPGSTEWHMARIDAQIEEEMVKFRREIGLE